MKNFFKFLVLPLALCLCLAGCSSKTAYTETANTLLTRIYTYPNEALVEFNSSLPDGEFDEDAQQQFDEIALEILGNEVDETYAQKLLPGMIITELNLSGERGIIMTPKEITLEGSKNNYTYTVTVSYTDADGAESEETITGRIQFSDEGKVNYLTMDKASYLQ